MSEVKTDELVVPEVHMNGTGKRALVDQVMNAVHAASKLLDALAGMSPHGRDYYVLGDDVFLKAREQHDQRVIKVNSVFEELQALVLKIDEQG